MASQLRPTRLAVTDRFPMLGFAIRTDSAPRVAEIVIATDPVHFINREGRNPSTFYNSREHGPLSVPRNEAVYVVPPEVLSRFVAADRLWFGLATASAPNANDWAVDSLPTAASPYISLSGFSDRAMRRVRLYPPRTRAGTYGGQGPSPLLEWAGDRAQPGMTPASSTSPPAAVAPGNGSMPAAAPAPAPADVPYDDGFGPLPPLAGEKPAAAPATEGIAPAPGSTAQSYARARAFEVDPETMGIEQPILDEAVAPQAMALGNRPRALTAAEYSGVTRIMPSPAYNNGRNGQAIDRIVIHITSAGQTPYIGSWFTREEANSSAHYMVDQNGAIIQFVREQDTAWHARGANRRSIGIEHVAVQQGGATYGSTHYPYTPPTDAEYRASAELVAHLCRKYGLTPDRTTIIGHREADVGTSHTLCPDGAWDWDAYMALVAACYALLPATGTGGAQGLGFARGLEVDPETMGIDGPACSEGCDAPAMQAGALALTAREYDRASRIAVSPAFNAGRAGTAIDRIVIHITDAPTTSSTVNHFTRADANSSAHYLVGQDGEVIQFVSEADTAWHARGANRRSIGIEHVAVKQGGATYGKTTFPYMPPTEVEYQESARLVASLCQKYGLTPDRNTIIGHREADTGTSHSVCPDGAWDWDAYMALVEQCTIELATMGVGRSQGLAYSRGLEVDPETMGIEGCACSDDYGTTAVQAGALALTAAEYNRVARIAPSPAFTAGRSGTAIDRIVIHITDAPTTSSTVNHFTRANANASAHYLVAQDGEIIQFVSEDDTAWHARGANRRSIGIEHVAVKQGGATYGSTTYPYMPPTDVQYCESAALVSHLCQKYGLSVDRTTIVGHSEADASTTHTSCPDGAWNWAHFMDLVSNQYCREQPAAQGLAQARGTRPAARAMSGGGELIEIKYRMFIPSPIIAGPVSGLPLVGSDYGGDGRGFSYSGGTSRGEITATVMLNGDGSLSDLTIVDRHWSPSTAYDSGQTFSVEGKPDWWKDKQSGAQPTDTATYPLTDDNLRVYLGGASTRRNVLAVTSQSSVLSIHAAGANPLAPPGAPDIDADISIYLRNGAGGPEVMVDGEHDGFPAHELYINGQRVHHYDPVAAGNGPTALFPPCDQTVQTSWIAVRSSTASAQGLSAGGARALDADDWSINWDEVEQIPQPTDMSCWATAAAMLVGWRDRQCVSPEMLAQCNGLASSLTGGLAPGNKQAFADALGLVVHPNACYTAEGFRDILEYNGPIWVTAKVPFVHAIVVTGMYRENGRYYVRITDPLDRVIGTPGAPGARASSPTHVTGSRYIMTYDAFAQEFEAAGDIDRIQLLHTGGTHGHVINRGSARAAGYAQALNAMQPPARSGAADDSLGFGTSLTRTEVDKPGRRYDLAQLSGMVTPTNSLAGGAGVPALPGERVVLDDWPFIPGPSGRTQAGIAIDWQYQGGAVGNVVITPIEGQTLDGWDARVRADIRAGESTMDRVQLRVRVTTVFSRPGVEDQVAVTEVDLNGDGRQQTRHGADQGPVAPAAPREPAIPERPSSPPQLQLETA